MKLATQYRALNEGREPGATVVDPSALLVAMPRSYQFLDASVFLAHNHILAEAWGFQRRSQVEPPLMYQGLSDRFFPAHGTVSNVDYRRVGSDCIAERRAIDQIEGRPLTAYLQFNDRVRLDAVDAAGRSVFGSIDQRVVARSDSERR